MSLLRLALKTAHVATTIVVMAVALGQPEIAVAQTQPFVWVTVTITRVVEMECDEGAFAACPDDYFSKVTIAGFPFQSDYVDDQSDVSPNWTFTWIVDSTLPPIPIDIGIWDHDGASANDELRASPGDEALHVAFNLRDGTWSGETNQNYSEGGDVGFYFTIDILGGSGDADGDGLLNQWESKGLDMNGDGAVDLNLPAWGADPNRKDIFVEIDCLVAVDHSHCPMQLAMEDVVRAFAEAPVSNPDSTSGIQLHLDTGPLYGAGNIVQIKGTGGVVGNLGDMGGGGSQMADAGNTIIDWDGATGSPGTSFYVLKQGSFDSQRKLVFRYSLFAHQTNARLPSNDCTGGVAEDNPANDFFVSLGGTNSRGNPCWGTDTNGFSVGTRAEQAGTFMHELGHALGLAHGGQDNMNFKPNYLSVMNYLFQMCGVTTMPSAFLNGGCDYSRIDLPDLNENNLDECVGIGIVLGLVPMDWNTNSRFEGMSCQPPNDANIQADINQDVQASLLSSHEDWNTLFYVFRSLRNFVNGVSSPVPDEPTPELIEHAQILLREQTKLTFDLETNGIVRAMAVQSDGKILVGGHFSSVAGQPRNQIARFSADGFLDDAFNPDRWGQVYALAVQADGKILLGGRSAQVAGQPRHFIARLNPDGRLDTTFTPDVNGNVRGLAVQSDGKILLVGQFTQVGGQPRRFIARLNPDGRLDTTFTPNVNPHAIAVAVQADGKILVGGRFTLVNGQRRRFLARLNPDGFVDTSFNPGSEFRIVSALALQTDGKILLVDAVPQGTGLPSDPIARLNPDGSTDTTFSPGANHYAPFLAVQGDGNILLGGNFIPATGRSRSYITRLSSFVGG